MDDMQEEYESAVSNRKWDEKREWYFNREGEPKVAEEVKAENAEVEAVKEVKVVNVEEVKEKVEVNEEVEKAVTEEQQIGEEVRKEEKRISVEEKQDDAEMKQIEAAENTEVPITEVLLKKTECQPKENRSSLAREEEAGEPCVG
ncbi:protein TIC 214-like [Helianthus annuus]|uniref:protein TIC 214-like n=1 Tax=Helianthus annuus TaxID=4232 RepID=UPI001652F2FA|nr:protein TIC 214-like [Helianthus annuus]